MKSQLLFTLISITCFFLPADEQIKVSWTNFLGDEIEDIYGIASKTYFYEGGKLQKLEFRDKKGQLISEDKFSSFYPAEFRYTYDSQGNYVSREAYNNSGDLMDLDGYYDSSILRFIYNSSNQLVERQTLDKEGKLLEMGDSKIAVIKYIYDEQARLTSASNYDGSGNALANIARYKYLEDGKLNKTQFLNLSNTLMSEIEFQYSEHGFLKAYTQVYPEENETYSLQFSYIDSVYTTLDIHSKQTGINKTKKRGVKMDLEAWYMEDSLLLNTPFQYPGEGEFKISIGPDGTVENLEPITVRAPNEFKQEVYELFRRVKLKKKKGIRTPDTLGQVVISILEPYSGFELIEFLKNPQPND